MQCQLLKLLNTTLYHCSNSLRRSLDGGANGHKYDSTAVPHTVTMYSVTVPLCTAGIDTASLKEACILQKLRFV